jgi:hypothetical protein
VTVHLIGNYGDSALNRAKLVHCHRNSKLVHCHRNSDAGTAYGKGSAAAKAAFIDIGSGRSTTQDLAATAQSRAPKIDLAAHMAGVRTNYDATYGAGSYDALIVKGKIEDAETQARVDAAQARFNKEIGCVILCPAAIALAPIIAAEAGIILGAKFGGGLTANVIATGTIAGTLNVGAEVGTNRLSGETTTAGGVVGAFGSGFIFGGGLVRFGAPLAQKVGVIGSGAILGAGISHSRILTLGLVIKLRLAANRS